MRSWLTRAAAAITACLWGIPALLAEQPPTPVSLAPCPFTAAEIESALELRVEESQAADMTFPDGRDVGCSYVMKKSSTVLSVRQTWDPANNGSQTATKRAGYRFRRIAGDPDAAVWQLGEKDKDRGDVSLIYSRGKVKTKVMVYGGTFRNSDMQPKLLKLKRVP